MKSTYPTKIFTNLQELALYLRQFARERDWEQYHSPKNLAAALSVEAAELLEHFQWKTEKQSGKLTAVEQQEVAYEMADVLMYLTRMADCLGIDLLEATARKVELNQIKYPAPDNES